MTIDEAAEALGIELLPWQREAGQRILDGEPVALGRNSGRNTLRGVLTYTNCWFATTKEKVGTND